MITLMTETLRLCTKCMEVKPRNEFSKRAASNDGLNRYCKTCMGKYYQANNGEQRKRSKARLRIRNRDHPEIQRAQHLKGKYNMTQDDYNTLFLAQQGRCAICGKEVKLVVDHNHETGKVRGLLCKICNYALAGGPKWLEDALAYLTKAGEV